MLKLLETETVIIVDENDRKTGLQEKMQAHKQARLHRAFSIFIYNSQGLMLLQQRALSKYHSAGLWTNACCSHPRDGETVEQAAHRRLEEEMGFDCPLKEEFSFIYKADLGAGLWEHEYDHVLTGKYDGPIKPNPSEAGEFKWIAPEALEKDVEKNPQNYTAWFKIAFKKVLEKIA